jgi:hypothetical protein
MSCVEDWYKVTIDEVIKLGGGPLLSTYYGNSLQAALMDNIKDVNWLPWQFEEVPQGFWNHHENRRQYFEWLKTKLNIRQESDWYKLKKEDIYANGGSGIFNHESSHITALVNCYPEIEWQIWRFETVPMNYWESYDNKRYYMDWVAEQCNISHIEGWYHLNSSILSSYGGRGLLSTYYDDSISRCLIDIYKDTEWQLFKFQSIPRNHWKSRDNQWKFMTWMQDKFEISSEVQWHNVTKDLIEWNHGSSFLDHFGGSMVEMLRTHYPTKSWKIENWTLNSKSRLQYLLKDCLVSIVGNNNIEIEYECGLPFMVFQKNNNDNYNKLSTMRFDIWIPRYNIAMEYQGIQHFIYNHFIHSDYGLYHQENRDRQKVQSCIEWNIDLIHVPFWMEYDGNAMKELLYKVYMTYCIRFFLTLY